MGEVLFVSAATRGEDALIHILRQAGLVQVDTAQSAAEGRRKINVGGYSIILLNLPLPDESGRDLALYAAEKTDAAVIVLIKAGWEESLGSIGRDSGVFIIPKPLNRQFFQQAVQLIGHTQRRLERLKEQNDALAKLVRDEKMAGRAKCYLVRYENMTETQAHHYLEAQAMEKHVKRSQIAEKVVDMYSERDEEEEQ